MRKNQYVNLFGSRIPLWKDCPECGKKLSCRFVTYTYQNRCDECQKKKDKWEGKQKEVVHGGIFVKRFKDVTGFMRTKNGEMVGITENGKFVKKSETRYDLQNDPFGWKAIGIKK